MLMTAQSAKELRMKHLPVWITASCDVSRFDADKVSLGENLMLNAQGGAAALITTSRTVYASQNLTLNKAIMHHPEEVQIAVSRPPESIHQMAVDLYEPQKTPMVLQLLGDKHLKKVILFAGKKQRVKELTHALHLKHVGARAMHSDLTQKERDEVMLDFRNGKVDVLVATDIVSRGIDVDDIPLVINYDVPRDAEDYVHRIGRTARAENSGEAITLVAKDDQRYFDKIEKFLGKDIERLTVPAELGETPERYHASTSGRGGTHKGGKPHHRFPQKKGSHGHNPHYHHSPNNKEA